MNLKIMFFDTETTWFNPPAILQIWIIVWEYTIDWKIISEEKIDLLFNPDEEINEKASDVHWITYDIIKDKPFFNSFISSFVSYVNSVDLVVGHNIKFDIWAIEFELKRLYSSKNLELDPKVLTFLELFKSKSKCTMLASIEYCSIPGKYGNKWPKLNELYKKLFNSTFENAHDAMADIQATRDCYFELVKMNIIK